MPCATAGPQSTLVTDRFSYPSRSTGALRMRRGAPRLCTGIVYRHSGPLSDTHSAFFLLQPIGDKYIRRWARWARWAAAVAQ